MSITLYTAPDCMRCNIVKKFLADKGLEYTKIDYKEDADTFNKFYRSNRKSIYRNPEGVEFPLFQDDEVIRQGSGEVLAWLLGHGALGESVRRSNLLHGKISGLYPDRCPADQQDNFVELVQRLSAGGLNVLLETCGYEPDFLERLLKIPNVRAICDVIGGAEVTERVCGRPISQDDLAKTIALLQGRDDCEVRFLAVPIPDGEAWRWPDRKDAAEAAKMVSQASNSHTLPYCIAASEEEDLHGLAPLTDADLLKYRSAAREFLFKADVCK